MFSIFESIAKRLTEAWPAPDAAGYRQYACQCGRPVFFRNSLCLGCKTPLGFEPEALLVRPLEPGFVAGTLKIFGQVEDKPLWKRCGNFESPAGCNWLVSAEEEEPLC